MIVKHGPLEARKVLQKRWKCCESAYKAYQAEAYRMLRAASEIDPAEMSAEITAKLRHEYATAKASTDRIRAAAVLAKVHGAFAPVQIVQTNLNTDVNLPARTKKLMSNRKVRAALLSVEEGLK